MISVVVPVHDEDRSVELLYDELASALDPLGRPWEAVYVDDGSTDGSFAAMTRLHDRATNVRVVRLRRNFGKSAALAAGFRHAEGSFVVTIDADLQDDPAEIPRLLAKLDEGFDLVSGWKAQRRDPWSRRLVSRIFNSVVGRASGLKLHDMNCGLKAYRAEVVRSLRIYGELHRFLPVLAHDRGFRVAELPVNHRPLHLFGGLGLVFALIGSAVLVYLTILKLTGAAIGHRPLLTLGVLLVVVGFQFFSLGLLSELITSHHEERTGAADELHVDEILEPVRHEPVARSPRVRVLYFGTY